jgi:type II secretory pathway pseudopilin PulG
MKKIKNQKGFSHVEVILLTVIVGIILVVGWYVWHSVSQANKNLSSANCCNKRFTFKEKRIVVPELFKRA